MTYTESQSVSAHKLLRTVRMIGRFDWLGGYTPLLVLDDGEALCPWCIKANYRELSHATRHAEHSGWCVMGITNAEEQDGDVACVQCDRTWKREDQR